MKTNWARAMLSPTDAMLSLTACLQAGLDAWIEIQKNGEQEYPIMKKNPELDNPFNWTMLYGTIRNMEELDKKEYFNETEKDLTMNWTAAFGTKEAVMEYQKNGKITEGLMNSGSICHPVRLADAMEYRKKFIRDGYVGYDYFVTYWKPVEGIERYVVDTDIDKVFVICYTDGPVDMCAGLARAAEFLGKAADMYRKGR